MKRVKIVLSLILGVLIVAGAVVVPNCGAEDTIKIGIPLPLTGRHSPFGQHIQRSFNLALEEINAAGGVRGLEVCGCGGHWCWWGWCYLWCVLV